MRKEFFVIILVAFAISVALCFLWKGFVGLVVIVLGLGLLGVHDVSQHRRAVLRNFPVIGHFRYLLEMIRPEINQYFIESNTDGTPFNREERSVVYQRAKHQLDTLPFGTQRDVYEQGYEWIAHSLHATLADGEPPRVVIGAGKCAQPYSAALLNISAMSYGSLSKNAIMALNKGAQLGEFAHNTGEGGLSPYHLKHGGDVIWQIGTGYFGCRSPEGQFDLAKFSANAKRDAVKMIEVKLSQGAKPGHGGILPAGKVTEEIASIRGVPMGEDVLSPPTHTAFEGPLGLLQFVSDLREHSGGKPVGFKLCVGSRPEFMALCKAMQETGMHPDFIAVDGGEGGTGAAPIEFSNSVGMPLREGLVYVHNCLVGFDLRDRVKIVASGKITTGFDMATKFALGADVCYSARAMMLAIGCIQARRCNANDCPVGVATQKPGLVDGLDVDSKASRVANFHKETIEALMELLGAAGLVHPEDLEPQHISRRVDSVRVMSYSELYPYLERGALLTDPVPEAYEADWQVATSGTF